MEYKIRSLKDIFELPTSQQMEICLDELVPVIKKTRALMDLQTLYAKEAAKDMGQELEEDIRLWAFPEEITWSDDDSGESSVIFNYPGGPLTMEMKHGTSESRHE